MPRIAIVYGGHHVVVGQYVGPQRVGLPRHGGHVHGGHLPVQAIYHVPKPTVHGGPLPVQAIYHVTQPAPQGDHCDISYKGPGKVAGQLGLRMIEVWGSVVKDCGPYPG
jgi:hypothetical protein